MISAAPIGRRAARPSRSNLQDALLALERGLRGEAAFHWDEAAGRDRVLDR
jgi:hypothetical protein